MKVWQRLQEAQSTLQKKREAEAKLLWANKPEKLQQAKDDINEVKLSTANYLFTTHFKYCTLDQHVTYL